MNYEILMESELPLRAIQISLNDKNMSVNQIISANPYRAFLSNGPQYLRCNSLKLPI